MINSIIELSKACDIKAVQSDAKNCIIESCQDIKNYFNQKNIEISDKLASDLFDRLNAKELSTVELSQVSAGKKYDDCSIDHCPVCGFTTIKYIHITYALNQISSDETICGDVYETFQCQSCHHLFYYWRYSNIWEDAD